MFDTLKKLHRAVGNHQKYRQTVGELQRLTNRELSDLGISRCDIYRVARENTK
jgi:uncharacterized protein YjiS (DUF1127 family)